MPFTAPQVTPYQDPTGDQLRDLSRGVWSAAEGAMRLNEAVSVDLDNAEVDEGIALLTEHAIEKFDGAEGYFRKVGRDAIDGLQPALKDFDETKQRIERGMRSPRAREVFAHRSQVLQRETLRRATVHHAQEVGSYKIGALRANLEAEKASYRATWQEGERPQGPEEQFKSRELHGHAVRAFADQLADMEGQSPEGKQQFVLKQMTEMHAGVLEDLLAEGMGEAANAYLADAVTVGQIHPNNLRRLQDIVRRGATNDEGRRRADEAIAGARAKLGRKVKLELPFGGGEVEVPIAGRSDYDGIQAQALADLDALKLPVEVYDNAVARVLKQIELRRNEQTAADAKNLTDAQTFLVQHPATTYGDLPERLAHDLEEAGLLPRVQAFSESRKFETSRDRFAVLLGRSDSEWAATDPQRFLVDNWGLLSPETMQWGLRRIAVARQEATPQQLTDDQFDGAVKVSAKRMGVLPSDRDPTDTETTAFEEYRNSARNLRRYDPKAGDDAILEKLEAGQLAEKRNLYAIPPALRANAVVELPGGRQVHLTTVPVDEVFAAIDTENAKRRELNRTARQTGGAETPLLPRTVRHVAEEWAKKQDLGDERDLRRGAELFLQLARERGAWEFGSTTVEALTRQDFAVSEAQAAELLGIPVGKLMREHGLEYRSHHTGGPFVSTKGIARYLARKERR